LKETRIMEGSKGRNKLVYSLIQNESIPRAEEIEGISKDIWTMCYVQEKIRVRHMGGRSHHPLVKGGTN
jgi:hypothetical protein